MTVPDDLYSRVDYRRMIAWPERIEREWPFLARVLGQRPAGRLLDLGCGTGEHARLLAAKGYEVVAIDTSDSMLEKARDTPVPSNLRFVLGDISELDRLVSGSFDGAICLGNTLPHIRDRAALERLVRALKERLVPGAPWVLQILNYAKILATRQRALPLNFRPDPGGGEAVFLRVMDPRPDGTVIFCPSTLRFRPDAEEPLTVVATRRVVLHGWTRVELEGVLEAAGFHDRELFGTVGPTPYLEGESSDLVIVARHGTPPSAGTSKRSGRRGASRVDNVTGRTGSGKRKVAHYSDRIR